MNKMVVYQLFANFILLSPRNSDIKCPRLWVTKCQLNLLLQTTISRFGKELKPCNEGAVITFNGYSEQLFVIIFTVMMS